MKIIYVLNIHSTVDIITNSSTEIFVCDRESTIETVNKILNNLLEEYNTINNSNLVFNDVFKKFYVLTEEEYYSYIEDGYNYDFLDENNIGKVIIEGGQNTIPLELMDKLEYTFSFYRYHY